MALNMRANPMSPVDLEYLGKFLKMGKERTKSIFSEHFIERNLRSK